MLNLELKQYKTKPPPGDFGMPCPGSTSREEIPRSIQDYSQPWDLSLVYSPQSVVPHADFVFIHGLRGDQVKTWCYKRSEKYFWLRDWLPTHPELKSARIWTFGYDSDFLSMGPGNMSDLSDFARSLLVSMKLSAHGNLTEHQVPIGKVSFAICQCLSFSQPIATTQPSISQFDTAS